MIYFVLLLTVGNSVKSKTKKFIAVILTGDKRSRMTKFSNSWSKFFNIKLFNAKAIQIFQMTYPL